MKKDGYDIARAHEITWKDNKCYVLGAQNERGKLNQLWIDKEKLFVKRFITFNGNTKEEPLRRQCKNWTSMV